MFTNLQELTSSDLTAMVQGKCSLTGDFLASHSMVGVLDLHLVERTTKVKLSLKSGTIHNDTEPALVEYDKDDKTVAVRYYQNGLWHREQGLPAYTAYDEKGEVEYEIFFKHGKMHNLNGPAVTMLKTPDHNQYALDGRTIDKAKYESEEISLLRNKELLKNKLEKL